MLWLTQVVREHSMRTCREQQRLCGSHERSGFMWVGQAVPGGSSLGSDRYQVAFEEEAKMLAYGRLGEVKMHDQVADSMRSCRKVLQDN